MMETLIVEGMQGMGDNIYQVPILAALAERHHGSVYLKTPWPEFYEGIRKLRFMRPTTTLRTQSRNAKRFKGYYEHKGGIARTMSIGYAHLHGHCDFSIHQALIRSAGLDGIPYHLSLGTRRKTRKRNYAVIRPPTIREEWRAPSRNPRMEYVQYAIDWLNVRGIETVVVADIDHPHELYDGSRPEHATAYFEHGELDTHELIDLFQNAKLVVGGVGFMVPMCIAFATPAVVLHGGAGGWNAPELIDAPGEGKPIHVLPENYCLCKQHTHNCDKKIHLWRIETALEQALETNSRSQKIGRGMTV
jgi:hypothetical protein